MIVTVVCDIYGKKNNLAFDQEKCMEKMEGMLFEAVEKYRLHKDKAE